MNINIHPQDQERCTLCELHMEGATLMRNAYNIIYSWVFFRQLLECMHMFNDSLDNWWLSLMADRHYQGRHKGRGLGRVNPLILETGGLWLMNLPPPYFELIVQINELTLFNHQGLFKGEPPINGTTRGANGAFKQGSPTVYTCKGPHTGMQGDLKDRRPYRKWSLQTKRPCRQGDLTYKGPYRQGGHTDKGPLQTRGPHRQGVHTDKGPLKQNTHIDDVYRWCIIPYMIYKQGRKGLLQTRDPYK